MPKATAARSDSLYGVHPGVAMMEKWVAELKGKTGRSVEEWIALVKKEAPTDEKSRREWLKTKHKLGTNSAWWLAERAEGKGGDEDTMEVYLKAAVRHVEEQYAGPKEKLRPIFDELLTLGKSLGSDVKACPCKTIVPCIAIMCSRKSANHKIPGSISASHWRTSQEIAEADDRHGWAGEKRSNHTPP